MSDAVIAELRAQLRAAEDRYMLLLLKAMADIRSNSNVTPLSLINLPLTPKPIGPPEAHRLWTTFIDRITTMRYTERTYGPTIERYEIHGAEALASFLNYVLTESI